MTNKYAVWDYEEGASPPYYHIYSLDMEPGCLELGWTIFTIACKQSENMDKIISELRDKIDEVVTLATIESGEDDDYKK
jgi:hypothetical protein